MSEGSIRIKKCFMRHLIEITFSSNSADKHKIFTISGLAILVVGVIAHLHVYSQYSNFVYPSYQAAPIILITVGVIIFLISFFGCCGAVKENHCMIITFSVLLAIILVAETAAGVVGYINRNEVEVMLENKLNSTMYKYYTNSDIRRTWDIAQHEKFRPFCKHEILASSGGCTVQQPPLKMQAKLQEEIILHEKLTSLSYLIGH
ncbi:hypothetical protein HUJ04_001606 [Dendroctonus ponderosae]|nr:hypothetical protein HUJ04_001606 [Dendroctonus ponderosae]